MRTDYSTTQYSAPQYSAPQYSAPQYSAAHELCVSTCTGKRFSLAFHVHPLDTLASILVRLQVVARVPFPYLALTSVTVDPDRTMHIHARTILDGLVDMDYRHLESQCVPEFPSELCARTWAAYNSSAQVAYQSLLNPSLQSIHAESQLPEFRSTFFGQLNAAMDRAVRIDSQLQDHYRLIATTTPLPLRLMDQKAVRICGRISAFPAEKDLMTLFSILEPSIEFPVVQFNAVLKTYLAKRVQPPPFPPPHILQVCGQHILEIGREEDGYQVTISAVPYLEHVAVRDQVTRYFGAQSLAVEWEPLSYLCTYTVAGRIDLRILDDLLQTHPVLVHFCHATVPETYTTTNPHRGRRMYCYNTAGACAAIALQQQDGAVTFTIPHAAPWARWLLERVLGIYRDMYAPLQAYYGGWGFAIAAFHLAPAEIGPQYTREDFFGYKYSSKCQPIQRHPLWLTRAEYGRFEEREVAFLAELETRMPQPQNARNRVPPLTDPGALLAKYARVQPPLEFPEGSGNYFLCNHPDYPYPGLKENSLAPLGYQVCGYTVPVRKRALTERTYMYKTNKTLDAHFIGLFPDQILNRPYLITRALKEAFLGEERQPAEDVIVVRYGIARGPSSFLTAVLTALYGPVDEMRVDLERSRLMHGIDTAFLAQEWYDTAHDAIRTAILDPHAYLDPLRTVRLLEHVYGCNILMLYRGQLHAFGCIAVPRHAHCHIRYARDTSLPTLVIHVHIGGESEILPYPHCELVARYPRSEDLTYARVLDWVDTHPGARVWSERDAATRCLWRLHDAQAATLEQCDAQSATIDAQTATIDAQTAISQPVNLFACVRPPAGTVTRQWIDAFGKVRWVQLVDGTATWCDPLPPLNLPQTYVFPSTISTQTADIARVAQQLQEWARWLCSAFIAGCADADLRARVDAFCARRLQVAEMVTYPRTPYNVIFDTETRPPFITRDGVILCNSEAVRAALQYQLRWYCHRNPRALRAYCARRVFDTVGGSNVAHNTKWRVAHTLSQRT